MGFIDKYGFEEDENVKKFHKSRIMFAVYNDKLYIAERTIDSHATWFKKLGWITEVDDNLMNVIVRGYVDEFGIYFYRGYDFIADEKDEQIFLNKALELKERLNLLDNMIVYAGLIKLPEASKFPPKKLLGKLSEILMQSEKERE